MSVLPQLREATWSMHQQLDRRLARSDRFTRTESYRRHLQRLWGFHAAVEGLWGTIDWAPALADIEERRRTHLLEADLAALGSTHAGLARCPQVPSCRDLATALGVLYVTEGATLGGRHLLNLVERTLGVTRDRGASYFASYGARIDEMWRRFGLAADTWCNDDERRARAAQGARAAFASIEEWLCGEETP